MQPEGSQDESFTEEFVKPSLKAGALGGTSGLLIGVISGVLRSKTPVLFATASGIQCACIGSTFWATRTALLHARTFHPPTFSTSEEAPPFTRLKASTFAGGLTGSTLGLLFRGPRNIIPGAIMFSIFGASGQQIYNVLDRRHTTQIAADDEALRRERAGEEVRHGGWRGFVESVAAMKYTPIKKLSDAEYEAMLQEKLVGVEADLALIDEEIEKVRREAKERTEETRNS